MTADLVEFGRRAALFAARRWYVVLAWLLAGETAAALLLAVAVWLKDLEPFGPSGTVVVMVLLVATGTLVRLVSVVGALRSVCDRMVTLPRLLWLRRVGDQPTNAGLLDTALAAVLPFLVLYGAWGYADEDLRRLGYEVVARLPQEFLVDDVRNPLIVVGVVAFAIGLATRLLAGRRWFSVRPWLKTTTVLVALFCDAAYLFLSVWGISHLVLLARIQGQFFTVWVWWTDLMEWARHQLGLGLAMRLGEWMVGWVPDVVATLGLPFLWLAVATIVYGHVLDTSEASSFESAPRRGRLAGAGRAAAGALPGELRFLARPLVAEPREKWVPLGRAVRLIGRGSPALAGACILGYHLLSVTAAWAVVGVTHLVGPLSGAHATLAGPLLDTVPRVLTWMLLVPLLAAGVDVTFARLSRESRRVRSVGAEPGGGRLVPDSQ
ncbi:MAG: hypothetical protein ACRDMV_14075 [Streptosporangiales bacterium]